MAAKKRADRGVRGGSMPRKSKKEPAKVLTRQEAKKLLPLVRATITTFREAYRRCRDDAEILLGRPVEGLALAIEQIAQFGPEEPYIDAQYLIDAVALGSWAAMGRFLTSRRRNRPRRRG